MNNLLNNIYTTCHSIILYSLPCNMISYEVHRFSPGLEIWQLIMALLSQSKRHNGGCCYGVILPTNLHEMKSKSWQLNTIDGLWFVIMDGQGDMFRFKILVFDSIWFGRRKFPGFLSGASWGLQHVLLWENLHLLEVSWKLGHSKGSLLTVTPVLQAFLERNRAENHAHLEEIIWTKSEPRQHAYPKSSESSKTATTNIHQLSIPQSPVLPLPGFVGPAAFLFGELSGLVFSMVVQSFFKQWWL